MIPRIDSIPVLTPDVAAADTKSDGQGQNAPPKALAAVQSPATSLIGRNWLTLLKEGVTCFRLAILPPLDYYWNAQPMRMKRAQRSIWQERMTPRC